MTYNARTDRDVVPLPALPPMPSAGTLITDPSFGTRILRVTDPNTDPSLTGYYNTTGGSFVQAWSQDSTRFFTQIPGGGFAAFELDLSQMPARFQTLYLGAFPLTGPCWGGQDRNVVYGMSGRSIAAFHLDTRATDILLSLDSVVPGYPEYSYALSCTPDGNFFAVSFGGIQDTFKYLVHWDRRTGRKLLLDLLNKTAGGVPLTFTVGASPGIHSQDIDKTGRWVSFIGPGIPAKNAMFWDTVNNTMTAQNTQASGHAALGYGVQVNQSGIELPGISDSRGFVLRSLDNVNANLVQLVDPPPPAPYAWTYSGHQSWNNARPDVLTPVLSSFYRDSATRAWSTWDDEIVAVRTDGAEKTVWRLGHHRSVTNGTNFGYDQPHGNVSPDGRWFIFTSNWGLSLGTVSGGTTRRDIFLLELPLVDSATTQGSTTTTLTCAPDPSVTGQAVTLRAAVNPPAATGNVTFRDGATTLAIATVSGGAASFTTNALATGTHAIQASYSGDATYAQSDSAVHSHVVNAAPPVSTTTSLSTSPDPSLLGQVVTMTALVSPAAAGGTVTFSDGAIALGSAPVSGGVATLPVSALAVGAHTISATYSPAAGYAGSSATDSHVVNALSPAPTTTTIVCTPDPSTYGQAVTLTATVSPAAATGTVTFKDGSAVLATAAVSAGVANYTTSVLAVGTHSLTASYSGNAAYAASASAPDNHVVGAASPPAGTNLLVNSGFENGATGWTAGTGLVIDTQGAVGVRSLKVTQDKNLDRSASQTVNVVPAKVYRLSGRFKVLNAMSMARIEWLDAAGVVVGVSSLPGTASTTWLAINSRFTAPAAAARARIQAGAIANFDLIGTVWVDEVTFVVQ